MSTSEAAINNVLDEINQLDTSGLDPDHGSGGRGFWPENGTYNCTIEESIIDPEGLKFTNDAGVEIVVPTFQLSYTILDGPHADEKVLGERWTLDNGPAPSAGAKKAREIHLRRLMGFFEVILGDPKIKVGDGIKRLHQEINSANPRLMAEIKFSKRTKKTKSGGDEVTFYAEHAVALIEDAEE